MEAQLDSVTDYLDLQLLEYYVPRQRKQSFTNLMPVTSDSTPIFDSLNEPFTGWSLPALLQMHEDCYEVPAAEESRSRRPSRPRPPKVVPRVSEPQEVRQFIGTLTREERQARIQRYLAKRKQRIWTKKICYDCRKRVADSRLRVKGRFVTKAQATQEGSPQVN